ncbi:hypothetical protein NL676_025508 [Syzygium grande]|nr:hypothetical protein NL676_025508 [Syzygium grande]
MILVPEVYKNHPTLSIKYPEVVDFYEYYKGQMEAWDGPALLLFRVIMLLGGHLIHSEDTLALLSCK